jgi:hypothetical protein
MILKVNRLAQHQKNIAVTDTMAPFTGGDEQAENNDSPLRLNHGVVYDSRVLLNRKNGDLK